VGIVPPNGGLSKFSVIRISLRGDAAGVRTGIRDAGGTPDLERNYCSSQKGERSEVLPMSQGRRFSTRKRRGKAMPVLGAAGLLALASGASAGAPSEAPTQNADMRQQVFLGEEEISDVSLATFYAFDKENAGSLKPGVQLVRGGGCGCGHGCGGGGCRGCGGCGGCARGCGGGCRAGFFLGGCGGCGGCSCAGCGLGWWGVYGVGCAVGVGCCISWGGCRYC
jgi:hypothetical protein